jgi:hypothetical protein
LISLGVYSSTSAQTNSINAAGNPAVICGPNEGFGYGVSSGGAVFSNMQTVVKNLAILTTHSSFGLTYGALNVWGVANAHLENVGYGTAGVVTGTDYQSPGVFGTGLSVGLLLPAPGNNDHVVVRNVGCGGGYTYAMFLTEHAVVERYMALYCWAGLCAVGTYRGSVGSVHAMDVVSASIEACTNMLYIIGAGSGGVGPTIYANISTESSTPNIAGNSTAAMNSALGRVRLTGLFTESGVSVSAPTGIEIVNGQVPSPIKRKTSTFTCSPIDRTLICDTTNGGFTGTLPDAGFNPVEYTFKNVGTNLLTVATTSSQLLYTSTSGATTTTVATGQTLRVRALYNGSAWGWYALQASDVDSSSLPARSGAVASAGTAALASPSDHVHPRAWWAPEDHGYLTWTYEPLMCASSGNLPTAGTLQLARVHLSVATTVSNVILFVQTAGSGLTAGGCFAGLYTSGGSLIAGTADQSPAWASTGTKVMALASAQALAAGDYYVGFYATGTTAPAFSRASAAFTIINTGLSTAASRWVTGATGLTTALPASAGTLSTTSNSWWAALS